MSILREIAKVLRKAGGAECLKKATMLEANVDQSGSLHLRSLGLKSIDIQALADVFRDEDHPCFIQSLSFSYNHLIGDAGATALAKCLPASIREIGLVDCGIGDEGGVEILKWMKKAPNLQMICMEQNNFSEELKAQFRAFKKDHPTVLVVT